jgi:hypothetical protein
MPDPLRVWLVENNSPFADVPKTDIVTFKSGIVSTMKQWFLKVLKHRDAVASLPSGFKSDVEINWSDVKDPSKIGDYDLIVYFSPLPLNTTANTSVMRGPYKDAISRLPDTDLVQNILQAIADPITSGGKTYAFTVVYPGTVRRLPAISEVFLQYDNQFSIQSLRLSDNIKTYATAAFHECAHNKYRPDTPGGRDRLHEEGGGGIFNAQYDGKTMTDDNVKFFAKYIWRFGPQYIRGQSIALYTVP